MKIQLPIETERLWLRLFQENDLQDLHAYYSRADVVRYLYCDVHDLDKSGETLERKMQQGHLKKKDDKLVLAIVLKETGKVIGEVMLLWKSKRQRSGEIGYVLNPKFHGYGYATEAARVMLRIGFETCGFHRIIANSDARNTGSQRVMERLGMRHEAHLVESEFIKGEWTDEVIYAMLEREWKDRLE